MAGYWERATDTAEALRGGWLHTGDIGRLDEEGYLFILDRAKDLIITGGANVYAREVEEVLLRHPRVEAVAALGLPDAEWGEVVAAVIVPSAMGEVSIEELTSFCGERLASYKKPRRIEFIESMPTSAYGKVLKRELRSWLIGESTSGE